VTARKIIIDCDPGIDDALARTATRAWRWPA
jgi:inosine-uridine nucleoside N-ribohydrolase